MTATLLSVVVDSEAPSYLTPQVAFDTTVHLLRLDMPYPSHLVFPLPHWFFLSLFALLLPLYCLPTQVLCLDSLP